MKTLLHFLLTEVAACLFALSAASFLLVYPSHWYVCRYIGNSYCKVVLVCYLETSLFILACRCEAVASQCQC